MNCQWYHEQGLRLVHRLWWKNETFGAVALSFLFPDAPPLSTLMPECEATSLSSVIAVATKLTPAVLTECSCSRESSCGGTPENDYALDVAVNRLFFWASQSCLSGLQQQHIATLCVRLLRHKGAAFMPFYDAAKDGGGQNYDGIIQLWDEANIHLPCHADIKDMSERIITQVLALTLCLERAWMLYKAYGHLTTSASQERAVQAAFDYLNEPIRLYLYGSAKNCPDRPIALLDAYYKEVKESNV